MRALEAWGWSMHRFLHRRVGAPLVDAANQDEARLTCVLLDLLPLRLLADIYHWLRAEPARSIHTFTGALTRASRDKRRWFVRLGLTAFASHAAGHPAIAPDVGSIREPHCRTCSRVRCAC